MDSRRSFRINLAAIALSVTCMTMYVWSKVEVTRLAESITRVEARMDSLQNTRSRLAAEIVRAKKPAAITERARQLLGMVAAVRATGGGAAESQRWR